MSYFLAFAGFAALIILHEFGHFTAAKAVGMRVERFSLFFPPLLAKVRRGETEYAVGAVPLGGYVKITGMNPNERIPPEIAHRAYYRQPVWKRIVVIFAGPFMNFLIAFAIIWALLLSQGIFHPDIRVDTVDRAGAGGRPASARRPDAVDRRQARLGAGAERHRDHPAPAARCARRSTSTAAPGRRRRAAWRRRRRRSSCSAASSA